MSGLGRRLVPAVSAMFNKWRDVRHMREDFGLYGGPSAESDEFGDLKVDAFAQSHMRHLSDEEVSSEEEVVSKGKEEEIEEVIDVMLGCNKEEVHAYLEGRSERLIVEEGFVVDGESEGPRSVIVVEGSRSIFEGDRPPVKLITDKPPKIDRQTTEDLVQEDKEALAELFVGKPTVAEINSASDELLGLVKAEVPVEPKEVGRLSNKEVKKIAVGTGLALLAFAAIGLAYYLTPQLHHVGGGHAGDGPKVPIHHNPIHTKPPVDTLPPVKPPGGGGSGFGLHNGVWNWGHRQT